MRETSEDRQNEVLTMSEVCRKWRCEAFKLPQYHSLDHALIRGKTVFAIAEIKTRSSSWRKYDKVMCGLEKVLTARQIGRASGLKTFLIVRWTDAVGYINFEEDMTVEIGGRKDRETDETQLVAMFNLKDFIFIRRDEKAEPTRQSSNFSDTSR